MRAKPYAVTVDDATIPMVESTVTKPLFLKKVVKEIPPKPFQPLG